jgi:DNA uptake protein ComE-like DNA-binding protein
MNSFKESFRNWFGYTRRERRSTFILLNIIAVIIGVRYLFPTPVNTVRDIPLELLAFSEDTVRIPEKTAIVKKQGAVRTSRQKKPLLEINFCDSTSLVSLPGIGPVLSSRIIKYRNLIGGFVSVGQLKEVYGLKEETYNLISPRLYADSLLIRKIKINSADFRELIRHPYFQRNEVSDILKYRELQGKITGIEEMLKNNLISPETGKKIRLYLDFEK